MAERLETCLLSTRKFTAARFSYGIRYPQNYVVSSQFEKIKALADKHSETLKNVKFCFFETETDSKLVLNLLKYLENMPIVEKITIEFGFTCTCCSLLDGIGLIIDHLTLFRTNSNT